MTQGPPAPVSIFTITRWNFSVVSYHQSSLEWMRNTTCVFPDHSVSCIGYTNRIWAYIINIRDEQHACGKMLWPVQLASMGGGAGVVLQEKGKHICWKMDIEKLEHALDFFKSCFFIR
ncbi:uncharacterized protein LOC125647441 [Ostrea edulis]|uniref:uncharacterized protein LOC125647441 n=1 Tax=Ostrea edulis TaxID=37623 RepID=UPI0024AECF56|nr:uncharacterized protein LOC125647441 [Ostrea edulis]